MFYGKTEDSLEGDMPVKASVVTKGEFIEIGVDVLRSQAVEGSKPPPLEKGEHPMDLFERNVTGHIADNTGIMAVALQPRKGRMAIGEQSCT